MGYRKVMGILALVSCLALGTSGHVSAAPMQTHSQAHAAMLQASRQAVVPARRLGDESCQGREAIYLEYSWFHGPVLYLNHCAVNDLTFVYGGGAAAAGLIAAMCPPCAPFAGALGAVWGVLAAAATWADAYCGNRGIYLGLDWSHLEATVYTIC